MKRTLLFTEVDRFRLGQLLASDDARGLARWHLLDELEWQLETSEAALPESIPEDVVTMNSIVRLVNVNSAAEVVCRVVYPEDVDLFDCGVSVLDPLGTSLIGCEVDDLVECESGKGPGLWRIAEIVFQPERSGAFHL
jgi:regulator of nucleoside diphosphate kinase